MTPLGDYAAAFASLDTETLLRLRDLRASGLSPRAALETIAREAHTIACQDCRRPAAIGGLCVVCIANENENHAIYATRASELAA